MLTGYQQYHLNLTKANGMTCASLHMLYIYITVHQYYHLYQHRNVSEWFSRETTL